MKKYLVKIFLRRESKIMPAIMLFTLMATILFCEVLFEILGFFGVIPREDLRFPIPVTFFWSIAYAFMGLGIIFVITIAILFKVGGEVSIIKSQETEKKFRLEKEAKNDLFKMQ
jgi:hypothetical protein